MQFTVHGSRLPVEKHKGCALFKTVKTGLTQRREGNKQGTGGRRTETGKTENGTERRRTETGEGRREGTVLSFGFLVLSFELWKMIFRIEFIIEILIDILKFYGKNILCISKIEQ